jgi:hypothetical protein
VEKRTKRERKEKQQQASAVAASLHEVAAAAVATPPNVRRSQASTPDTVSSVAEGQGGELEVYIFGRLDKIVRILDEEESL